MAAFAFEVRRFAADVVGPDVALLEIEGRFRAPRERRLGTPALVAEGASGRLEVAPVVAAPASADPDGSPWSGSFALPLTALADGGFALLVGRVLVELPSPAPALDDDHGGEGTLEDVAAMRRRADAVRAAAATELARVQAEQEVLRREGEEEAQRQRTLLEVAWAEADAARGELAAARAELASLRDEARAEAEAVAALQARAEADRAALEAAQVDVQALRDDLAAARDQLELVVARERSSQDEVALARADLQATRAELDAALATVSDEPPTMVAAAGAGASRTEEVAGPGARTPTKEAAGPRAGTPADDPRTEEAALPPVRAAVSPRFERVADAPAPRPRPGAHLASDSQHPPDDADDDAATPGTPPAPDDLLTTWLARGVALAALGFVLLALLILLGPL